MKVGENGGVPVAVTKLERPGLDTHRNPTFLPDGKHFLYCAAPANASVAVGSLRAGSIDGGFDRKVLDYASSVAFVNGWLLSVRDRNLIAQRFDTSGLAVAGKPVAIAQNIDWYPGRYVGTFAAGAETLVYQHAAQPRRQLLRLDVGDARPVAIGEEAFIANPAVSADGRRAIVNRFDSTTNSADLWMVDLGGGAGARLTFTARGRWTRRPCSRRTETRGIDGSRRRWRDPLVDSTHGRGHEGWAPARLRQGFHLPDRLVARWQDPADQSSAHGDGLGCRGHPPRRRPQAGAARSRPIGRERRRASPRTGNGSPTNRTSQGRPEVYVTSYPAATAKWQVSTEGGSLPSWSADGRQLYYLAGDRVVAAAVQDGASFSAGAARGVEALGDRIVSFSVARSGRIVAVREIDPGKPPLDDRPELAAASEREVVGAKAGGP